MSLGNRKPSAARAGRHFEWKIVSIASHRIFIALFSESDNLIFMEREITVTEAARNFAEVVARAFYLGESVKLIKNGRAVARIVPVEDAIRFKRGLELAKLWADPERPRLSSDEAGALEADLKETRRALPPLKATSWE